MAKIAVALACSVTFFTVVSAQAADFTITKDLGTNGAGTFSFTDTNPSAPVFEIVVSGLGQSAGTTRPGFSASTILFGTDPQNCLPVLGSTITSGFCYKLTDPSSGSPITGGTTTLTYDSSFDTTDPSDFAIAFTLPNGTIGACFGNTGGVGCNATTVPEPGTLSVLLGGLLASAFLAGTRARSPL